MRKIIFLIPLILLLFTTPIEAKKHRKPNLEKRPYLRTDLATIHDSIASEGYALYLKEKIAWTAEDMFFADCTRQDMLQGMLVYGSFPTFHDIFFNLDSKQCFFEVIIDVEKGIVEEIDSIRPLTDEELAKNELQNRLYYAASKLNIQVNEPPLGCTFNYDWIRVDDNRYRVFVIMGCNMPHLIPWGNDLSYDCDSIGNILDVRKYHQSSILIPTVVKGEPVKGVFHSHTDLHPLITSTDIAIFLLYGEDLNSFKVLSQGIYYIYDKNTNKIHTAIP